MDQDLARGLTVVRDDHPGAMVLRLSGTIDGSLSELGLADNPTPVVIFDLDGVERITSNGIREWARMLEALRCQYYAFTKCRPAVVMQFNMVSKLAGEGELVTFYMPYACQRCAKFFDVLLDLRRDFDVVRTKRSPRMACPTCKAPADFDDTPSFYFEYAATKRQPAPPPAAMAAIDAVDDNRPNQAPFRIEKKVVGALTVVYLNGTLDGRVRLNRVAHGLEGEVLVMADKITQVEANTVDRLRPLLEVEGASVFLARVSTPLFAAMLKTPAMHSVARFLSVDLAVDCKKCESHSIVALDHRLLSQAQQTGRAFKPPCPTCAAPAVPAIPPELLDNMRSLRVELGPASCQQFLGSNDGQLPRQFGQYFLIRPLGKGGMAEIFLADHHGARGFRKRVVVKQLLPHLSRDVRGVGLFLQEARLAARLMHPNIVEVYDLGEIGGTYFISMEYVRGLSLDKILRMGQAVGIPMPFTVACRWMSQSCAGLQCAHTHRDDAGALQPIIHRDVSPKNVIVSDAGVAKISDFGIAKAAGSVTDTEPGRVIGTPAYLSPEQILDRSETLDARSDVFGVGLILFECLTYKRHNEGDSVVSLIQAALNEPHRRVSQYRTDLPPEVDQVVAKALAKNRQDRYPTAEAMQNELDAIVKRAAPDASDADAVRWLEAIAAEAAQQGIVQMTDATPSGTLTWSDVVLVADEDSNDLHTTAINPRR